MGDSARVGVIGVGNMGRGVAATLLGHGHELTFLDRHPHGETSADLRAAGGRSVSTIGEVVDSSDLVIVCVTGTPEVETVVLAPGGVLEHLRPGTVVIDHSTAIPSSTARVAERVTLAGGRFLDAPMTGTPRDAAAGQINLLVGGDPAVFKEHKSFLESYARKVIYAGPVGAGHKLKLLHNFVSLGFATVLAEAVACAKRAGIDTGLYIDVLANGGGKSAMLERMRPFIETGDTTAYRFSIANGAKDLGYYAALAQELDAARAVADAARSTFVAAIDDGHGAETIPEMVSILEA